MVVAGCWINELRVAGQVVGAGSPAATWGAIVEVEGVVGGNAGPPEAAQGV